MKTISVGTIALAFSLNSALLEAYKEETHAQISAVAATQSALALDPQRLPRIGLEPWERNQRYPNSAGELKRVIELFQFGATFEDSGVRAISHFYDPLSSEPLIIPGIVVANYTSPDWALEDTQQINGSLGVGAQDFSYRDARQYFYLALTALRDTDRKKYFGLTFQTLGQVIHHLQDMAQPQHVRNDAHLDKGFEILGMQLNPLFNPSLYESYTNNVRNSLPYVGTQSAPLYPDIDLTAFPTPRTFWWQVQGKGIAQFTNYNFVSASTNFGTGRYSFPLFDSTLRTDIDVQQLCANALPPCANPSLTGQLTFFGNRVHDDYTANTTLNPYASTYSILDADLTKAGRQPVFSLNRFNFDLAHGFLVPRAVAYSAGLINYFFRGQMRITLPERGVYGVVDHAIPEGNDPQSGGFAAIKVKLQNITPGGTDSAGNALVEPMTSGSQSTLIAIAKFHRNNCYRADLGGEYGSPGIDWRQCRSAAEEVVVSNPATVPSGINADAQSVTFVFPNKIPISATDLYLQVLYRGPLGQEQDAVVVETKDLSEPTYLYNYSRWDQYTYPCRWPAIEASSGGQNLCTGTPYTYAEWCGTGGFPSQAACNEAMGYTNKIQFSSNANPITGYDPANPSVPQGEFFDLSREPPFNPVATLPAPVGALARVAVLTDANPSNVGLVILESRDPTHGIAVFQWFTGLTLATINQLDAVNNTLTPSVAYLPGRGVFLPSDESFLLNSGTAHPPLLLVPSPIGF